MAGGVGRNGALGEILVLGDPPLTAPLMSLLAAAGAQPRTAEPRAIAELARDDETAAPTPMAVVWCLDRPVPPGLWDAADRLPALGIAWARCHREGEQVWIEPVAAGPGGVLAAHLRARRLAATPAHRELAAYWAMAATDTGPAATGGTTGDTAGGADRDASGDAPPPAPGLPAPSGDDTAARSAAYAVIAGLLAGDLLRALDGGHRGPGAVPGDRRLRRVDLRDMTITEHPVLPVPAVAPLPSPTP
ncbi:hypothetical protein [Streptomyces sp. URMC 123]|uniref:hypothetical protein n=1 Tax=Streptomyces sp. URMC 123 TaxID=3423403 RepID=UPI003F1996AA